MAREVDLSKPLDAATVKELRSRYSNEYVDRMVYLSNNGAEPAASEPDEVGDDEEVEEDNLDEDLIGDAPTTAGGYDPSDHTVDEVIQYLKGVSPEERSTILQLEKDGRQRSSLLNYFAS